MSCNAFLRLVASITIAALVNVSAGCGSARTDRAGGTVDHRRDAARRQTQCDVDEAGARKRQPLDRHDPAGQDVIDQPK